MHARLSLLVAALYLSACSPAPSQAPPPAMGANPGGQAPIVTAAAPASTAVKAPGRAGKPFRIRVTIPAFSAVLKGRQAARRYGLLLPADSDFGNILDGLTSLIDNPQSDASEVDLTDSGVIGEVFTTTLSSSDVNLNSDDLNSIVLITATGNDAVDNADNVTELSQAASTTADASDSVESGDIQGATETYGSPEGGTPEPEAEPEPDPEPAPAPAHGTSTNLDLAHDTYTFQVDLWATVQPGAIIRITNGAGTFQLSAWNSPDAERVNGELVVNARTTAEVLIRTQLGAEGKDPVQAIPASVLDAVEAAVVEHMRKQEGTLGGDTQDEVQNGVNATLAANGDASGGGHHGSTGSAVASPVASEENLNFVMAGDTATFTVDDALDVSATSNAPGVCTVEETTEDEFEVTAVGAGRATITVRNSGGKTDTVTVTVTTTKVVIE